MGGARNSLQLGALGLSWLGPCSPRPTRSFHRKRWSADLKGSAPMPPAPLSGRRCGLEVWWLEARVSGRRCGLEVEALEGPKKSSGG